MKPSTKRSTLKNQSYVSVSFPWARSCARKSSASAPWFHRTPEETFAWERSVAPDVSRAHGPATEARSGASRVSRCGGGGAGGGGGGWRVSAGFLWCIVPRDVRTLTVCHLMGFPGEPKATEFFLVVSRPGGGGRLFFSFFFSKKKERQRFRGFRW